jgi:hypothetical protein
MILGFLAPTSPTTMVLIVACPQGAFKNCKKGWGRMSSGCFQKSQKKWGTHVLRVLSKISKKYNGTSSSSSRNHAIYSIYNIDMYICPGQLPPEQIHVETINPVM